MTMAIDNEADVAADRSDPADLRLEVGRLIADPHDSPFDGARIAEGQSVARAGDLLRDPGAGTESLRILIVEEDPEVGGLLSEILAEFGHFVYEIEVDGAAAAVLARRRRVDLIIVDIGLGEARAIAAVEQILEERLAPHVVVIADTLRGLALAPNVALIQKPFHGSTLIAAIARTIKARAGAEHSLKQSNRAPALDGDDDRAKPLMARDMEIGGASPGGASRQTSSPQKRLSRGTRRAAAPRVS